MSLLDEIRAEVEEIASERGLPESKAFGYWFLEKYEDLSPEDAEDTIIDGPWDGGRDAVYLDEENRILKIYQFKYSEDLAYVRGALTDLQNGIIMEQAHLTEVEAVNLIVVTLASVNSETIEQLKTVRRQIRHWLTRHKYRIESRLEIIDLTRFREQSERLYGVNVTLRWKVKEVEQNTIIGLLDASGLRDVIDREELFSFNVRKFLGLRKGSVGWKIREALRNEEDRNNFWILNNGIVCLCTEFWEEEDKINFQHFAVVNGAQTINTSVRFLQENPVIDEPIWVVAKVLKVQEDEIDWAAKITESSNT